MIKMQMRSFNTNSAYKVVFVFLSTNKRPVGLSSFVNCPPVVASFLIQRQLSVIAGWQHMGRVPHPYYINPGYGLSLVDTLWNASSYRQPLEQEGDPMTWIEKFWLQISLIVAKEVINVPPVPSISRCIHIVYRHKNVWEYQWSNFIYNCMSTFLNYVHRKDALLDCSAPGGERCESLTWVDETSTSNAALPLFATRSGVLFLTQAWLLLKWKFTRSSYLTRPTLEHRWTLGRLRSIYPDMINHFANQSQTCQLFFWFFF